jgi:peptide/nickel transport system substrate-binding protein
MKSVAALMAVIAVAAGCGGDDGGSSETTSAGSPTTVAHSSAAEPGTTEPGETNALTPVEGDFDENATVRVGNWGGPESWDIHKIGRGSRNMALFPVYDRLIMQNPDGSLVPGIAENWEFVDDDTALVLHLREGVTFQDGSAVDAAAVVANIERQLSGNAEMANAPQLATVSTATAVDPLTVRLEVTGPSAFLPAVLSDRAGALVCPSKFDDPTLATQPCGAGPFTLESYEDGVSAVYARFEDYWNRAAIKVAKVDLVLQLDETTRQNSFDAGDIDINYVNTTIIDNAVRGGHDVDPQASLTFWQLNLNRSKGALGDVEVRRAINHAIDREALIDGVLFGYADATQQPFPSSSPAYNKDLAEPYWDYNPDAARQILADAGYADGDVEFTCIVSNGGQGQYAQYAEVVQQQLAQVGITMGISVVENAAITREHLVEKTSDCSLSPYDGAADPSVTFQELFSAGGYQNPAGTSEPAVEAAYEATLVPGDGRPAAIAAMVEQVMDQALVVPLFFPQKSFVVTDQVEGVGPLWVSTNTLEFFNVGLRG